MKSRDVPKTAATMPALVLTAFLVLLTGHLHAEASAYSSLDLSAGAWRVSNANSTITWSTTVPSYALEDLRVRGVIGDPLYRFNERHARWVAFEPWTYALEFNASDDVMDNDHIDLVLHGVDTFASIQLNGQTIATVDNYHRRHIIPVEGVLMGRGNLLVIAIAPAFNTTLQRKQDHPYTINTLAAMGTFDTYNFMRKPAFDFGWDWGPPFAASGIHGKVELVGFSEPVLTGVHVNQHKEGTTFLLDIEAEFRVPAYGGQGALTAEFDSLDLGTQVFVLFDEAPIATRQYAVSTLRVPESEVQLWWPAGFGAQPLYDLATTFLPGTFDCLLVQTSGVSAMARRDGRRRRRRHPPSRNMTDGRGAMAVDSGSAAEDVGESDETADVVPLPWVRATTGATGVAASTPPNQYDPAATPPTSGRGIADAPRADATGDAESLQLRSDCGQASEVSRRIGFRTIEVVQDDVSQVAKDLLAGTSGWRNPNGRLPDGRYEGQWALVDGKKWTFVANPPNIRTADTHSGYNWSAPPGGDDTWWWYGSPDNLINDPTLAANITGTSMYFRVNGVPIYAKGANIIPFSILKTNVTEYNMWRVLKNAVDSNMNMLRVWGGGLYQDNYLYDFCDTNGLLVWEESMFACSQYPRDHDTLDNIRAETEEAVRRIGHHASLAIWGGNNEIEASIEWYKNTRNGREMVGVDFTEVFVNTIGGAINRLMPDLTYLDSSPTNGLVSTDPYIKRWGNPQDPRYGDAHFYDYSADCQDFRTYPQAKFVSEYGFQSYPTWATWRDATGPEDWPVGSEMFEWRNRHFNGTYEMIHQIGLHFAAPTAWQTGQQTQDVALMRSFIYFTQIQQMLCYETSVGYWRRLRSEPDAITMGMLYWQLNDVWAGPTWSGIDQQGRWKPLQYAIKRQFAPLVVQAVEDAGIVRVFAISDLVAPQNGTLTVRVRSFADTADVCNAAVRRRTLMGSERNVRTSEIAGVPSNATGGKYAVTLAPNNAHELFNVSVAELLASRAGCSAATCYLQVQLEAPAVANTSSASDLSSEATLFFAQLKDVVLPDPGVTFGGFVQVDPTTVRFVASASRPAPHTVWETEVLGKFTDNAVTLHPCEPRTVTFATYGRTVTATALRTALVAHTLWGHSE